MRVRDLMSRPAVAVGPQTPLKQVAEILRSQQISAVPVVDSERRLLGILSEADLLELETVVDQRHQATPVHLPRTVPETAGEAMTLDVISVDADTDAGLAAQLMIERRLRHMPVVELGRLAGMLSRRDLIGMLARSDSEIEADVAALLEQELGRQRPAVKVRSGHLYVDISPASPQYWLVEVLATSVPGVLAVSPARVPDRQGRPAVI
ncbi:MAG TPA: CBS domain-containing protein [Candidatus Dormibacteraeota bacterium]